MFAKSAFDLSAITTTTTKRWNDVNLLPHEQSHFYWNVYMTIPLTSFILFHWKCMESQQNDKKKTFPRSHSQPISRFYGHGSIWCAFSKYSYKIFPFICRNMSFVVVVSAISIYYNEENAYESVYCTILLENYAIRYPFHMSHKLLHIFATCASLCVH